MKEGAPVENQLLVSELKAKYIKYRDKQKKQRTDEKKNISETMPPKGAVIPDDVDANNLYGAVKHPAVPSKHVGRYHSKKSLCKS